jgi:DNA ligase D-like protein (predicted ligase)
MPINYIKPMFAVTGNPFSDPGWIFEPKIDGTRCIAHVGEDVVMLNRRHTNITHRYPELVNALAAKAKDCILDGEIAVFSNGKPDFAALAAREHQNDKLRINYLSKAMPASYIVFDILESEGKRVMDRPLSERKTILSEVLQEDNLVIISDFFPVKGDEYFQAALKMGIEGIMAKRLDSTYQPGVRSPDWIKIKKRLKFDLVVGGYIPGKGHREPFFGGLLLGAYDSDRLIYVGRVGSGFSFQELEDFAGDFEPVSSSPFFNTPATPEVRWLKPRQVVEVAAMEVTADFSLRAPVFLRRRFDKDPKECSIDQIRK